MPSTLALDPDSFPDDRRRAIAIAVWMTTFSIGVAVGPIVGGVMLSVFWWGSVFLLAVPVMLVVLLLGPWLLPRAGPRRLHRLTRSVRCFRSPR